MSQDSTEIIRARHCQEPSRVCQYDLDRKAINSSLREIQGTLAEIQGDIRVGNQRFSVLEKIVYGACAAVGLTVIGGLLATVIHKG